MHLVPSLVIEKPFSQYKKYKSSEQTVRVTLCVCEYDISERPFNTAV